jgi:hypothetical protein
MPGAPKRHHFVPEMLIRNFADDQGLVWFFDKEKPAQGVVRRSPSKVLFEHHLYSKVGDNGSKDPAQEIAYSRLESDAAPIVRKVVTEARAGKLPGLTPSEKLTLDAFIYEQWRRVPEVSNEILSDEEFERTIQETAAEFEERVRPLTPSEREWVANPALRPHQRKNTRIQALQTRSARVLDVLDSRGLAVLTTPPRKSLILGSRPVLKLIGPNTSDLRDHSVELWLPLAFDVAVSPGARRGTEQISPTSVQYLRHMNRAAAVADGAAVKNGAEPRRTRRQPGNYGLSMPGGRRSSPRRLRFGLALRPISPQIGVHDKHTE